MSWLGDYGTFVYRNAGKFYSKATEYSVPGLAMKAFGVENPVSNFYQREFVDKADLRGAEGISLLSGLPIIGNFIRGVEGVNQLEDLYNSTGKVPAYPGSSGVGASGIGQALGAAAGLGGKIVDGVHDLFEFYTGDKDDSVPQSPMPLDQWRKLNSMIR